MKKVAFLLLCLPIILQAQKNLQSDKVVGSSTSFRSIEDSIKSKIKRDLIPSFSVAVSKKGQIVWQQSFGWADKENKIKATPSTSYALASLSKSITSTAIMLLVEKGLISLNQPVEKYLGKSKLTCFKSTFSQITINHLLNMTAGIPHQWEYFYADEKRLPIPIEKQIERYGISVFPPGEVFLYSNFSPSIAEQIIKHASKKSLPAFMKEKLFLPLGMKYATVIRNGLPATAFAKGYDNKGHLLAVSEFYPKAGAGYYASVADLLRYGMFHLKDENISPILKKENIDILHTPTEYTPHNKFYANGWGVLNLGNGKSSLISNGAIDGAASTLLLLPDNDIAIACLTNGTVGNDFTDEIAYKIAEVLLPGYLAELEKFFDSNAPAFADKPFNAADKLTGIWDGEIKTYLNSIPIQMTFDSTGKIFLHIQGQFETLLNNVSINNGVIQGQCFGKIPLPETGEFSQYLELVFKPSRNEIYGSISSQSFQTKRPYFLIPAYLLLKKK